MNQDIVTKASNMLEKLKVLCLSEKAWQVDPLGHTEYQLKHFVIGRDNPTQDTKFKQCIRELWARWNAAQNSMASYEEKLIQEEIYRSEIIILEQKPLFFKGHKAKRNAEIKMYLHKICVSVDQRTGLNIDLERRILREAKILISILQTLSPSDGLREEIEKVNWEARAQANPEVKKLIPTVIHEKGEQVAEFNKGKTTCEYLIDIE